MLELAPQRITVLFGPVLVIKHLRGDLAAIENQVQSDDGLVLLEIDRKRNAHGQFHRSEAMARCPSFSRHAGHWQHAAVQRFRVELVHDGSSGGFQGWRLAQAMFGARLGVSVPRSRTHQLIWSWNCGLAILSKGMMAARAWWED